MFVSLCWLPVKAATIYGPSGLILNPSAHVPPEGAAGFGISTFTVENGGTPGDNSRWLSSTLDFGLGGKGEVGLTYLRVSDGSTRNGLGGFAKYQFLQESPKRPAVAVGLDLIRNDLTTTQYYVVATKRLSPPESHNPFTLTGGVMQVEDRDGRSVSDMDAFGGFDIRLAPHVGFVAEWRDRTEGNLKDSSGAMLTYAGKKYGIGAGLLNNGNSESHQFFIGVGFNVSTLD